jgi:hypothetical protein
VEGGSFYHSTRVVSLAHSIFYKHTPLRPRPFLLLISRPIVVVFLVNREIYDLQLASQACAHCTTPLTNHHLTSLILHCPTTSSTTSSGACPARFCNRLCLKRSEKTHPLLCPAQNPASVPLLTFARKHVWMALHALAQCTARLLLAHQQKQGRQRAGISSRDSEEEGLREDWSVYCALADLGMEERVKGGWCVCVLRPARPFLRSCVRITLALKVARCGA